MVISRGGGGGFRRPVVAVVVGQLGSGSETRWDLPLAEGGGQKHHEAAGKYTKTRLLRWRLRWWSGLLGYAREIVVGMMVVIDFCDEDDR
ncbi:ribonuclease H-like domain-containing protein [Tanacetum coccineum]